MDALVRTGPVENPWDRPIANLGGALGLPSDASRAFAEKLQAGNIARIVDCRPSGQLLLSFAKNASADMSLRGNAFITVMQTAELRDLDDSSHTRYLPRNRTLLAEAQMGPRSMVVTEI